MKKFIAVIAAITILFTVGCSSKEKKVEYNTSPYTSETAIKNGDAVNVHGRQYNSEKMEKFVANVDKGIKDKVRITTYTVEGGAIITDLEYDGKKINYTNDNTRDGFGVPRIDKKKFDADSIYKKGSNYYLKNKPEDIFLF